LEYLRRRPDEVWQSLMLRWLREYEGLGLVLLEDLGLEMAMYFNRPVEVGERLEIKVTYADPRQDIIRFAELSKSVA
jgi:exoribonuclease II